MTEQPIDAEAMKWALDAVASYADAYIDDHLGLEEYDKTRGNAQQQAAFQRVLTELAARAAGHWTREAPTEPGWYWVRGWYGNRPTTPWQFERSDDRWTFREPFDADGDYHYWGTPEKRLERWSVPIEMPV